LLDHKMGKDGRKPPLWCERPFRDIYLKGRWSE